MLCYWFFALLFCALACDASVLSFDRPLADFVDLHPVLHGVLANGAARVPVIQSAALVLLVFGGTHPKRSVESLHRPYVALQAGVAMTSAMGLNALLLKPLFGRAVPWLYVTRGQYGFHAFHGSTLLGSFPSGHAAVAAALASVLWVAYPKSRPYCVAGIALLSFALIFGEFHFLSDLIAGCFVGATIGFVTLVSTDRLIARHAPATISNNPAFDMIRQPSRHELSQISKTLPNGIPCDHNTKRKPTTAVKAKRKAARRRLFPGSRSFEQLRSRKAAP